MQREVVAALFGNVAAEPCVPRNVFQSAGDLTVADLDARLQISYGLTEKVCPCRNIRFNRQGDQKDVTVIS